MKKKLSFWEKIFSLRNEAEKKNITILGFTITINMHNILKKKYAKIPVDNNTIAFFTHSGGTFGCNPKYIALEILKRKLPYKILWMCRKIEVCDKNEIPKNFKILSIKNKKDIEEFSSAKIYLANGRITSCISKGWEKREGQKYIQTWHGSLGIKRFGKITNTETYVEHNKHYFSVMDLDTKYLDYLISNSEFENMVFENEWKGKEILQLGHARNDIFFYSEEEKNKIKEKVCNSFNIDSKKKIILYAPTFRDENNLDCYNIDTTRLLNTLKNKFGNNWILLTKLHPWMIDLSKNLYKYSNTIIDVTKYPDIQELLVSSDIMITDYSSCIFDFILSRKPAFIYATDIEKYNYERGFYYPLESTPFPIATNNDELIQNIENFDEESYKIEVEEFLKGKGCIDDGHSAERIVDFIEEIIGEHA